MIETFLFSLCFGVLSLSHPTAASSDETHEPSLWSSKTVESRWRHYQSGTWYDPYNTNILKGDLPVFGSRRHPWFFEITLESNSLFEFRSNPSPVGGATTERSDSLDLLGNDDQFFINQNILMSLALIQGNTTFKPPNLELRVTPVLNINYLSLQERGLVKVDPRRGTSRTAHHLGFQELFADIHVADISKSYDFISSRWGIQSFNADFKGFLYFSQEPGLRLFGNADENRWIWNLAYFRRLEKDTNSGLNSLFQDRAEDIFVTNLYRQDFPVPGHTLQAVVLHREDHAGDEAFHYNKNGLLIRPASIGDERAKNISTTYGGLNGDGKIGRWNLSESFYMVWGEETHSAIAGRRQDIRAYEAALEVSYDFNWYRLRASMFWASGDADPFDETATGFDAVVDSPAFAGGDFSYWQRQGIPFIAGGAVALVNRQSLLANLRAGKEEGQSNFVNPGLRLVNLGVDIEITPRWKSLNNYSYYQFDQTEVLEALRQDGSISRDLGHDLSTAILYRPFLNNHMQVKAGAALFIPGQAFSNLFGDDLRWQAFSQLVFVY